MSSMKSARKHHSYKKAGVDIAKGDEAVRRVKRILKSANIGRFAGGFPLAKLKGLRGGQLIASIDGVGTKTMVAALRRNYTSIGVDLVNHCANDLLCVGGRGLFFLDYIAMDKLKPKIVEQLVRGMARACRAHGISLVGGETAEMPGVYVKGEVDVAGCIVGVVAGKDVVDGTKTIRNGDVLIGLASNGLHTNGYSLARKVLVKNNRVPRKTLNALLKPHTSYVKTVFGLRKHVRVQGLAHITGGGLEGNVSRILPKGLGAFIDAMAWPVPWIFREIQEKGNVEPRDMFSAFNMGIGFVVVVPAEDAVKALRFLSRARQKPYVIGVIAGGSGVTLL